MENLKMHSLDKTSENVAKIAALFPNCVTEARGADDMEKRPERKDHSE